MTREALRAAIDAQVARLVARAAIERWPIRADHCFLRIAYDNAVSTKWDTLVRPPAWRNLAEADLAQSLWLLGTISDEVTLCRLNDHSLQLRAQVRGR